VAGRLEAFRIPGCAGRFGLRALICPRSRQLRTVCSRGHRSGRRLARARRDPRPPLPAPRRKPTSATPLLRWYPMAVFRGTAATAGRCRCGLGGRSHGGSCRGPSGACSRCATIVGPVLTLVGLGVFGGQRDDQVCGVTAGSPLTVRVLVIRTACCAWGKPSPPGGTVGQGFDGAGFAPAVSVVAALVPDRDFGPRQRFEQTVQRRLVRLHGDREVGAAGSDLEPR
jgi:hypothetical protein